MEHSGEILITTSIILYRWRRKHDPHNSLAAAQYLSHSLNYTDEMSNKGETIMQVVESVYIREVY